MKRIILSIDGGGVRGLLSATVLAQIEQTLRAAKQHGTLVIQGDLMRNMQTILKLLIPISFSFLFFISAHAHQACGTRNNGDGTITVIRTGLQYQACPLGSRSVGREKYFGIEFDKCESISNQPSQEIISASTSQGAISRYSKGEWRLITPEEAKSILPDITECQPLNTWTSERYVGFTNRGGSTSFTRFGLEKYPDDQARSVQLVRNTKSSISPPPARQDPIPSPSGASSLNAAPSQSNQPAQQAAQQSQQLAQQNQARADQQRQGKRKTNNDAAQAHSCIEIDKEPGLFGGFKNTCDYKVNYDFCNFKPKKDSWAAFHDCEKKHGIGADAVGPGRSSAAHNRNTEMVYWFACKDPSWPVDSVFVLGKGIEARCH